MEDSTVLPFTWMFRHSSFHGGLNHSPFHLDASTILLLHNEALPFFLSHWGLAFLASIMEASPFILSHWGLAFLASIMEASPFILSHWGLAFLASIMEASPFFLSHGGLKHYYFYINALNIFPFVLCLKCFKHLKHSSFHTEASNILPSV